MPALSVWVDQFSQHERPVGTVLPESVLMAMGVAAANKYAGYAKLSWSNVGGIADSTVDITLGEWSIIRPLFLLYVERENAIYLEASRATGLEVFGRTVSEIAQDIAVYEADLPRLCFSRDIISI